MNTPTLSTSVFVAIALSGIVVSQSVQAETPPPPVPKSSEGKGGERLKKRMMEEADTNGDGKIDELEKAAAKDRMEERLAKLKETHPDLFSRIDTNGDGELSKEEKRAAKELLKEHMKKEVLAKFDANKDGKLDDAEKAAARAAEGKKQ